MEVSRTMQELQKIKEECSLRRLSRTPEEQKLESKRLKEWFEGRIGRKVNTVDYSKHREAVKEKELAQV